MSRHRRKTMAAVIGAAPFSGCVSLSKPTPVDPAADFSAHLGYFGIVVDRMDGGESANVVRADASNGPAYLLESDDHTVAALWMTDRDHVDAFPSDRSPGGLLGTKSRRTLRVAGGIS